MRRVHRVLVGALLILAGASTVGAQADANVLFVCEHGTVKSLLAKVLFDEYAKAAGLRMTGVSRGTKADSLVPAWMQRGLAADHVDLGSWQPQTLRRADLATASYVVSFDVPSSATMEATAPRVSWNGLPALSEDYAAGREAIKLRVRILVDSLKRARTVPR